jgi:hypothetical protein
MTTEVQEVLEALEAQRAINATVRRLADQATRRAGEAWRHADEATRAADEVKRLADEEKQRVEMSYLLLTGEYYSPIECVFSCQLAANSDEGLFEALLILALMPHCKLLEETCCERPAQYCNMTLDTAARMLFKQICLLRHYPFTHFINQRHVRIGSEAGHNDGDKLHLH